MIWEGDSWLGWTRILEKLLVCLTCMSTLFSSRAESRDSILRMGLRGGGCRVRGAKVGRAQSIKFGGREAQTRSLADLLEEFLGQLLLGLDAQPLLIRLLNGPADSDDSLEVLTVDPKLAISAGGRVKLQA